MLALDQIQTVAFAGIVLFIGYAIRRMMAFLARYNIPAPVIGGLVIAAIITAARARGVTLFTFDTALQTPLIIMLTAQVITTVLVAAGPMFTFMGRDNIWR